MKYTTDAIRGICCIFHYFIFILSFGKILTGVSKAWVGNSSNVPIELSNPDSSESGSMGELVYDGYQNIGYYPSGKTVVKIKPTGIDMSKFLTYKIDYTFKITEYEKLSGSDDFAIIRYTKPFTSDKYGYELSTTPFAPFPVTFTGTEIINRSGETFIRGYGQEIIIDTVDDVLTIPIKQDSNVSSILNTTYQLHIIGYVNI